ncbi:multicopper oxidase domain-containing protein [Streptomyces sp. NPDC005761]|uniref:multicopper oxidase domain-containing protein n=1 Tax=unclassified Streptomyces TaxID=2593676 RepID=UPI0033E11B8B
MAALAVLPLTAAVVTWRRVRWAPIASLLAVVAVIATRTAGLSFDLTRPGDPLYFTAALLELAAVGAVTGPVAATLLKRRTSALTGGPALAAALALSAGHRPRRALRHPFHLHSYPVQVIDRDGKPEPFRAWRDTVNIPAGTTVRLAVPFRGEAGRTVYHCHISAHEDLGMMGILEVAERDAPPDEGPASGR